MAAKRRVFQVAKEFNISNEMLITYLTKLDFSVKTHMSPITEEMYDALSKKYSSDSVSAPKDIEFEFRKRLRDRKAEEEKRNERKKQELEERIRLAQEIVRAPLRKKRSEPSRQEVLKIAEAQAKAEAASQLRSKPAHKKAESAPALEDQPHLDQTAQAAESKADKKQRPADKETTGAKPPKPEVGAEAQAAPPGDKEPSRKKRGKKSAKGKPVEEKAVAETNGALAEEKPETDSKKRKRRKKKPRISQQEIDASIKQTLANIQDGGRSKKRRKRKSAESGGLEVDERNTIKVSEFISASDLAKLMNVEPSDVLRTCLQLGMMVSINQRLDMDAIETVADEFGFEVEQEEEFGAILDDIEAEKDDEADLEARPPVVTIMGHVDHGKTSLLDYIRRSNIIKGEAGGITQHIGAYEVDVDGREICFLDTPGHEAFTAMRARGAQVTDIVILIVAADDGVQQQTLEAISHAKAAGVPIVVAINKIDKQGVNPDKIKQELAQHDLMVESWGGKYQSVDVSAKNGDNIDKLLESVLLEADLLELKANPNRKSRGVVIESELDRGKGPVATVLVQSGTLKIGDPFVVGLTSGRVRAMFDERGKRVKKAPPSTPVRVVGFSAVAQAGDSFVVMPSEKEAKDISLKRQQLRREQEIRQVRHRTLDQISKQIAQGGVQELKVIVKGDVDGSIEAVADSLMKLSTDEVSVHVIHKGVGGVSESDVKLAVASEAIIIGFNIRVSGNARDIAKQEDIDIRIYKVIYDAVNDVKAALEGLLRPELVEEVTGSAEVRETFKVPKIGLVAGCYVTSGKIRRKDLSRVYRDDKLIYEGKLASLRRFKDDVREVASGFECGVGVENFNDVHVGDIIECIQVNEVKRSLN